MKNLNLQELSYEETIQVGGGSKAAYEYGKTFGKGLMFGFTMIGVIAIIAGS